MAERKTVRYYREELAELAQRLAIFAPRSPRTTSTRPRWSERAWDGSRSSWTIWTVTGPRLTAGGRSLPCSAPRQIAKC